MEQTEKDWSVRIGAWGVYCLALLVAVIVLPVAVLHPLADYDTLVRYAPMAEAFSRGVWADAFHPRFGVLYPVLTGVVCLITGLDGLSSCVAVSCLFWTACIIPLYYIARQIFGRDVAYVTVVFYIICPLPLQWAFMGLREPIRMFGILLSIWAVLIDQSGRTVPKAACICIFSAGLAILSLIKVDGLPLAFVLWAVALFFGCRGKMVLVPLGSLLLAVQFPCLLIWSRTGYWLPVLQLRSVYRFIFS